MKNILFLLLTFTLAFSRLAADWSSRPPDTATVGSSITAAGSCAVYFPTPGGGSLNIVYTYNGGTPIQLATGSPTGSSGNQTASASGVVTNVQPGQYVFSMVWSGSGNATNLGTTVTTTVKTPITSATIAPLTYNGTAQSPYAVSNVVPSAAMGSVSVSAPAQTNAGTYSTATVAGTGNYTGTLNNVSWNINKINANTPSVSASANPGTTGSPTTFTPGNGTTNFYGWTINGTQVATYNGSAWSATSGSYASGNWSISGLNLIVTPTTTASYTVNFTDLGNVNYNAVSSATLTESVNAANNPPNAAMSIDGQSSGTVAKTIGQAVSITISGNDVDGNLRAVNLWVNTPATGIWRNIRADSTLNTAFVENNTTDNALSSGGANVASLGSAVRTFNITLNEGLGTYQFVTRSIDAAPAASASQQVNVQVDNRAPSGTYTMNGVSGSATVNFGQSVTIASTATDLDGNMNVHSFWWDQGSGLTWTHPILTWSYPPDQTGWSNLNIGANGYDAAGGASSTKSFIFTPNRVGTFQFHCAAGDGIAWVGVGNSVMNVVVNPALIVTTTTVAAISARTYSASTQNLPVSATVAGAQTVNGGTVTFTFRNSGGTALASTSGAVSSGAATGTIVIPAGTAAAAGYYVTADYAGYTSGNYTWNNSSGSSAAFAINPISVTFSLSQTSFTYSGAAQGPTVIPSPAGATFTTGGTLSATAGSSYTATATANGNYSGSNSSLIWTITAAPQTITFPNPGTQTYGTPVTLTATTSSGLGVSYAVTAGPATVSGNAVTFTGTGSVTVQASQGGNANYSAATPISQTFAVNPRAITITLAGSKVYDGTTTASGASASITAGSLGTGDTIGYAFTATSSANVGTYSGLTTATMSNAGAPTNRSGSYTITYAGSYAITGTGQTITFPNPGTQTYGTPVTLTATASSGLGVTYAVTAGPATVSSNVVTFTGSGSVTVQASQAGNANYSAATPVSQSFTVNPRAITITLAGSKIYNGTTGATGASASITAGSLGIGDTVGYAFAATSSANVGTYSGLTTATMGNASAPTNRSSSYTITYAGSYAINQATITGATIAALTYTGVAQSPSGAASTTPSGATVSVSAPTQINVGTYTTASVSGTGNYTGTLTGVSWSIAAAGQTITFPNPGTQTYGTPVTLSATSSSGLAVSYAVTSGPATVSGNVVTFTGTGSVTVQASQAGNANYGAATPVSQTFVVNPRAITITLTGTKVYDGTTTATGASASITTGNLGTGDSIGYAFSATSSANVGTYTGLTAPTISNAGAPTNRTSSYTITYAGSYTVTKATPTVTWGAPVAITYGTALSAIQLNATATVAGSFVYSPPAGTVLNAGVGQTLSVTFTPTDTTNYNPKTASTTITVNKATPSITWPTPADIVSGTALSSTQLNATTPPAGSFVYAPPAGTVLAAGAGQTLSTTFTPTDTTNYNGNTASVQINVTAASTVVAPTFSPGAGSYTSTQNVTISSSTSGATIRYTTDGSTPTSSVGTVYTTPVSIAATTTLKAIAYKSGMTDSTVTSGLYTISAQVAPPTFSPPPGSYVDTQNVTISTITVGATIRYTIDGSTPTSTSGTVYVGPVSIPATATLKAIAFKSGMTDSPVVSGIYAIQVVPPSFSPIAGSYIGTQNVTISTTTAGATIRYTTDGSTPTASVGTVYTTPVSIPATATLKAIAYKSGMVDSAVTSGTFTIQVVAPTFSPVSGTYATAQSVTISTTTSGASIRYTTDGSTPTSSVGTLYSTPVNIPATATLKAIAYKSGMVDSTVTSGTYTIAPLVAAPTFSPVAGTYLGTQNVTISSATAGATIRYTTDGSTPSSTVGTLYSAPVSIAATTTLKAIAYASGMTDSTITSGNYTITTQVLAPTFSPVAGTYTGTQSVTISSATPGASIRYTTDGSTPTSTVGTVYSSAVSIPATTTLKAIAYFSGMVDSAVTSGTYTIRVTAPTYNPAAGTYTSTQNVTITTTTAGATIRYTTDGSTPSSTVGTVYSTPVSIAANTTLKAIAYKSGMSNSTVTSGTFNIRVSAPTFNPVAGTYSGTQNVTIATTTVGATIRYTTDGSTPSATVGTVYSTPVSITANTTLKAIAYKTGMSNSTVTSGTYTIKVVDPTFTPAAGIYMGTQNVTIATATAGASIRYTTDGSTPSATVGTVYSTPVSITANTTLKAIAYKTGMGNSNVVTGSYTINVVDPVFSPVPGTYPGAQSVTISTATSGASIRYTTDGSTPSPTVGTVYSAAVSIPSSATLKAIAYKTGMGNSNVVSGTYTINLQSAAPSFSPVAGTYAGTQSVTISSTTPGASIRYTTDGSTPTSTVGTVYSGAVSITANTTLKAVAYKSGMSDSTVTSGTYTIQVVAPAFSPGAGSYSSVQNVTITSATSGATIRYTTNGTTPSSTVGTVYSTPVNIAATSNLKAIAYKGGMADSTVTSGTYTLTLPPSVIITVPANGATFSSPASITLTATATDTDGTITSVQFFKNGVSLGTVTTPSTPPSTYTFPVSLSANGSYSFTAQATDNSSQQTTSAAVAITVQSGPAVLPFVADFEPAEGYVPGALNGQLSWVAGSGISVVTAAAPGSTQEVSVAASATEKLYGHDFSAVGISPVFVDFLVHPVAGAVPTAAVVYSTPAAQIALVGTTSPAGLWIFDGSGRGWYDSGKTVPIDGTGRSVNAIRLSTRENYVTKKWDIYLDSIMIAADVPFTESAASSFTDFSANAHTSVASSFDDFYAGAANPLFTDIDRDGMEDTWESAHGLNPNVDDRNGDLDADGLTNIEEYVLGSKPETVDSDGDGLTDLQERTFGTNPNSVDSDGDGMRDGWEKSHGLNPLLNDAGFDPDNDGRTNLQEYTDGTDPQNHLDGLGLPSGYQLVLPIPTGQYLGVDTTTWAIAVLPAP